MPTSVNGTVVRRLPIHASPASAPIKPTRMSISVVLPQPLGPRSETNSPALMLNVTSRSAATVSLSDLNTLEIDLASINAAEPAPAAIVTPRPRAR